MECKVDFSLIHFVFYFSLQAFKQRKGGQVFCGCSCCGTSEEFVVNLKSRSWSNHSSIFRLFISGDRWVIEYTKVRRGMYQPWLDTKGISSCSGCEYRELWFFYFLMLLVENIFFFHICFVCEECSVSLSLLNWLSASIQRFGTDLRKN